MKTVNILRIGSALSVAVVLTSGQRPAARANAAGRAAQAAGWQIAAVNPARPPSPLTDWRFNMAVDSKGNIYAQEDRAVKEISPQGKVLWSVPNPNPAHGAAGGVAVDRSGAVYLNGPVIAKLSPAGKVVARWRSRRLAGPVAIAVGVRGNLFALYAAREECCYLAARIEKLSSQGEVLATWYIARGSGMVDAAPNWIAVAPSGVVYVGVTAQPYCYQVECRPKLQLLRYTLSPAGKIQRTQRGQYVCCRGMTWDARGNLYGTSLDSTNRYVVIVKRSPSGKVLATRGQDGRCGPLQFGDVAGLGVDAHGTIYVGETVDPFGQQGVTGIIHVLAPDGTPRALWGRCPGVPEFPLRVPTGVAVDSRGGVYVMNQEPHGILAQFSPAGIWLATWNSNDCHDYPSTGTEYPTAIASGPGDTIYVASEPCDGNHQRVQKFSAEGKLLDTWPLPRAIAGQQELREAVHGMAVDPQGNIYAATHTRLGPRLLKLSPRWGVWEVWGSWPGGDAAADPWGVALDAQGSVYVVDAGNHCIQKLSPAGEHLTCLKAGARYIAIDSHGNLYVSGSGRIQKLSPAGKVMATWDAEGTAAGQFHDPLGITLDRNGNLYVADSGNNRIQKLESSA
jgi:DNA-binding beta-propeller fold protein YncE